MPSRLKEKSIRDKGKEWYRVEFEKCVLTLLWSLFFHSSSRQHNNVLKTWATRTPPTAQQRYLHFTSPFELFLVSMIFQLDNGFASFFFSRFTWMHSCCLKGGPPPDHSTLYSFERTLSQKITLVIQCVKNNNTIFLTLNIVTALNIIIKKLKVIFINCPHFLGTIEKHYIWRKWRKLPASMSLNLHKTP